MPTYDISWGKMASQASGPLLSEEGEVTASKESITNIPDICRSLCLYYFCILKWFVGEIFEKQKMRQNKRPPALPWYMILLKQE